MYFFNDICDSVTRTYFPWISDWICQVVNYVPFCSLWCFGVITVHHKPGSCRCFLALMYSKITCVLLHVPSVQVYIVVDTKSTSSIALGFWYLLVYLWLRRCMHPLSLRQPGHERQSSCSLERIKPRGICQHLEFDKEYNCMPGSASHADVSPKSDLVCGGGGIVCRAGRKDKCMEWPVHHHEIYS